MKDINLKKVNDKKGWQLLINLVGNLAVTIMLRRGPKNHFLRYQYSNSLCALGQWFSRKNFPITVLFLSLHQCCKYVFFFSLNLFTKNRFFFQTDCWIQAINSHSALHRHERTHRLSLINQFHLHIMCDVDDLFFTAIQPVASSYSCIFACSTL